MTNRIRWTDEPPGTALAFTGRVGTLEEPAFHIYGPTADHDRWLLSVRVTAGSRFFYADDPDGPDELKAEAERWLEEFVESLGAVFPEPAAERASWPSADELAEMSMHDQEMWERRCAEAETPATPAPMAGEKENGDA